MDYTHIVVKENAGKPDEIEYLYRASDGIRIGGRQHAVVVYGENPNQSKSHRFIDAHHAHVWLTQDLPLEDLKNSGDQNPLDIDWRSNDSELIIIPDGVGEEFMGTGQKIRRIVS